jgi:hypothetical protein
VTSFTSPIMLINGESIVKSKEASVIRAKYVSTERDMHMSCHHIGSPSVA